MKINLSNRSVYRQIKTHSRIFFMGLVILGIILLPVRVQAFGLASSDVKAGTGTPTPQTTTESEDDISWLSPVSDPAELASSQSLAGLAGKLISNGLVDASSCKNRGLLANGYASSCGEIAARNAVTLWQNQFDQAILFSAQKYDIPPFLLKNIIIRESQFWPARHLTEYGYYEFGLAHITQMGADTLLRWDSNFSNSFCRQVFSADACKKSYVWMPASQQAVLRGAVLQAVSADCPSCLGGIDLDRARASIPLIAATVSANQHHAIWLLKGFNSTTPNKTFDSAQVWRMGIANYNAGPGCVTSALTRTMMIHQKLEWKNISKQLDSGCSGAVAYVQQVTTMQPVNSVTLAASEYDNNRASKMVLKSLGMDEQLPEPTQFSEFWTPAPTAFSEFWTPMPTGVGTALTPGSETPIVETATPCPNCATETVTAVTPVETVSVTLTPDRNSTATGTLEAAGTVGTSTEASGTQTPTTTELLPTETVTPVLPTEVTAVGVSTITATSEPIETSTPLVESGTIEPTTSSEHPTEVVTAEATATPEVTSTGELPTATPTSIETLPGPSETATPSPTQTATETATSEPETTAVPPAGAPEEIVARFNHLVPDFLSGAIIQSMGGKVSDRVDSLDLAIVQAPAEKIDQVLKLLQNNFLVNYAEPNFSGQAMFTPNDPLFTAGQQNNLYAMYVPAAWDITQGAGVIVAVIDTGVDTGNSDLSANIWTNSAEIPGNGTDDDGNGLVDDYYGWNFVTGTSDVSDLNGHGTFTAGLIAAQANNGIGMAGVAPQAKIMALKVLDDSGFGTYANVAAAITYAVDHGAKVINLGFGGISESQALTDATNYAYTHGVTVVAAVGNSGSNATFYPAANPNVIGVGALDDSITGLANFSTFGSTVDLVAPGADIFSTLPGGAVGQKSGTSVSAAQISGIAALLATQPYLNTPNSLLLALQNSALNLGDATYYGHGLAQAADALIYFNSTTPTTTPGPAATSTLLPSATPTGTLAPTATEGVRIPESYWAASIPSAQSCLNGAMTPIAIASPENSAIGPFPDPSERFDGLFATCTGQFGANGGWTIPEFTRSDGSLTTDIGSFHSAEMKLLFYFSQGDTTTDFWTDDVFELQSSTDAGVSWTTIATFDAANPPPTILPDVPTIYDISSKIKTTAQLNDFELRIQGISTTNTADDFTINLDQASLSVIENFPPSVKITAPVTGRKFFSQQPVTFTGTAADTEDGNMDAKIQWVSDIDGLIGTGASLTTNTLTNGKHTITARVTDIDGVTTSSATISIRIGEDIGPHGAFTSTTDSCALCHRDHSARTAGGLLLRSSSSSENNDFCLSCHSSAGTATVVSTHSNTGFATAVEGNFELLCVQCHDPHGSTGNMFVVRAKPFIGTMPTSLLNMTEATTPVIFTSMTGANSFDNTGNADSLCVTCHIGLTINHAGGAAHMDGIDYSGLSCIVCHPHDTTSGSSPNGFMPTRSTLP